MWKCDGCELLEHNGIARCDIRKEKNVKKKGVIAIQKCKILANFSLRNSKLVA